MEVCHTPDIFESPAAQRLRQFIRERVQAWQSGTPEFEAFERELHEQMMVFERELVAEELARYDVAAEQIEVSGVRYQPVLTTPETYLSAAGPVRVVRHLYRPAGRNARSICPLELRVGMVAGYWTPRAARLGAFVVAQLTPGETAALFQELGAMCPSRSSLDRLPRDLSSHWEKRREVWEDALRAQETIPAAATTVALSVDGVMAPMKAAAEQRQVKRAEAGKHASGPTGYREVGCGTVSLYDRQGERLQTVRYARMPERNKVTLQTQLQAELRALVELCPALRQVHLADGAEGNWTLLAELAQALGLSHDDIIEIVDFYHACDHLKNGCDAIWGESTPRGHAEFLRLKTLLKEDDQGAERIIWAFKYQLTRLKGRRHQRLQAELTYFRNQRARMQYAEYQRLHLPIASGVMEAACQTLVTQRLKRSGMAWTPNGGQAILTLRSLIQSHRWPTAWQLLSTDFRQTVILRAGGHPSVATAAPISIVSSPPTGTLNAVDYAASHWSHSAEHLYSQFQRCTHVTFKAPNELCGI